MQSTVSVKDVSVALAVPMPSSAGVPSSTSPVRVEAGVLQSLPESASNAIQVRVMSPSVASAPPNGKPAAALSNAVARRARAVPTCAMVEPL